MLIYPSDEKIQELVSKAKELCEQDGHTLLYLTLFGSHLYGTATESSDIDLKGIYLPNKEQMLLGKYKKSLNVSSGNNDSKNTKDDFDIELWSLQHFLNVLLPLGDVTAMDVFFSSTHAKCMLYHYNGIFHIFNNPSKLIEFQDEKNFGYIDYISRQAKKYGIKGSRVAIILSLIKELEDKFALAEPIEDDDVVGSVRLEEAVPYLLKYQDDSHFYPEVITNKDVEQKHLYVCGFHHHYRIKLRMFYNWLIDFYNKFGERAKLAEKNQGIDWKAISHAYRCIQQMKDLLLDGIVKFPLTDRVMVSNIKQGYMTWKEAEYMLQFGLDELDKLKVNPVWNGKREQKYVDGVILGFYQT